jgi:hypothetical protein
MYVPGFVFYISLLKCARTKYRHISGGKLPKCIFGFIYWINSLEITTRNRFISYRFLIACILLIQLTRGKILIYSVLVRVDKASHIEEKWAGCWYYLHGEPLVMLNHHSWSSSFLVLFRCQGSWDRLVIFSCYHDIQSTPTIIFSPHPH